MDPILKKHLLSRMLNDNKIKKLHGNLFTTLLKLQFL